MNDRGIAKLLDYLRRDAPPGPDLLPDADLLARFAANRDEAAFELLVRRHGPMVLGTARRVLRNAHSAEDVFQATFLALARKSQSLRRGGSVAGWLHSVAFRAALRLRKQQDRILIRAAPSVMESPTWELTELRAVLDEEVARLPERFRDAVVHCYLAGRTTEEAASALRCPRGTVLSRLAAARKRLQTRLTRRGYGLPAAGVAALWGSESAPALTPTLIGLAVRAAGPAAAIAPGILKLTEGVLNAMMITKLKIAAGFVLAIGLVGIGVGQIGAGPPAKEKPVTDVTPDAKATPPVAPNKPNVANQADARADAISLAWALLDQIQKQASRKRVELRCRIEDCRDQVEELRTSREVVSKEYQHVESAITESQRKISDLSSDGKRAESDSAIVAARKSLDSARERRDELLAKRQNLQGQLSRARRELIEAEEELTLHEQFSQTQIEKAKMRVSEALKQ